MDFNKKMELAKRLVVTNWIFIALQLAALTLGIVFSCTNNMPDATLTLLIHCGVYFAYIIVEGLIEEYRFLRIMYPDCYKKSVPSHWTTRTINNYKAAKMCGDSITCTLIVQQGIKFGLFVFSFFVYGLLLIS